MATGQNYSNHMRFFPPFHFFVVPILLANFIIQVVNLVKAPSLASAWTALVAFAIVLGIVLARFMSLRVQDRVIRAEERLRLARLAPKHNEVIARLSTGQLIAIRFAPDDEVPNLLEKIAAGELMARKDIKRAVKNWRPDYLRA